MRTDQDFRDVRVVGREGKALSRLEIKIQGESDLYLYPPSSNSPGLTGCLPNYLDKHGFTLSRLLALGSTHTVVASVFHLPTLSLHVPLSLFSSQISWKIYQVCVTLHKNSQLLGHVTAILAASLCVLGTS